MSFSSNKNRKLKVKLWWVWARERKKRVFFVPFSLSKGNFFNIYVLAQCILYWIHFQNVHIFTYQKALLIYFCCFFLKSSKALSVSLIAIILFIDWKMFKLSLHATISLFSSRKCTILEIFHQHHAPMKITFAVNQLKFDSPLHLDILFSKQQQKPMQILFWSFTLQLWGKVNV